ncbi:hypothetical protein [Asticcacaulis taihuensis]|uniref:hypothetical protein n=1 Tax=Asticcacaulis taihuensis TaxID=260084 RepID=UPI0026EA3259|nr:hypothetical protein [Asticcacaulis taihuensis]
MTNYKDLQKALNAGTYVRLTLADGEHEGFVIALSPALVLLQAIHEWQDVGALVAPVETVEAVEISDYHDDQIKILDFNSVKRTKRYGWVRLGGWQDLFKSLQFKEKFVVVSAEDGTEVGLIDTIEADCVVIKAIDPGGNWQADEVEWPFDDITLVQFDDSYSRTLQRYVEKRASQPTSH